MVETGKRKWSNAEISINEFVSWEKEPYCIWINFNPANHNYCRLLCLLLVTLKVTSANSVDPDQTAPLGAVSSGSTLFARMQK